MFGLHGRRSATEEKKRKQLEGSDLDIGKDRLNNEQWAGFENDLMEQYKASPSASVRSIIKTAIKDAEQIVASIKMRAQAEAEEEAAQIIAQAKKEAEEVKGSSKTAAEKEIEDSLSVAEKTAEEKAEEPAQPVEEAAAQLMEEAAASEPVTAAESLEQHSTEQGHGKEETKPAPLKQDSHSLYTGEVEIAIGIPVDPNVVAKLYNYLQTTPEIKFVRTSGSWNRGTTITVVLDKPIPLISVISSKIPEAEITPEQPGKDGFVKERKGVRRINLALKKG